MTPAEAIEIVARKALADHTPTESLPFTPLTLAEAIASGVVKGRAAELDAKYYQDPDNYVVQVLYADRGYGALYEVGPSTPDPICWAD